MNTWKHSFKSTRQPAITSTRRLEAVCIVERVFNDGGQRAWNSLLFDFIRAYVHFVT